MENITRNVDELAAPQRKIIEDLLGHELASNQQIFIMAFVPGTVADEETRNAARTRLQVRLLQSQRNAESNGITPEEADAAVDEAMEVKSTTSDALMRILLDTNILARAAGGPPGLANELVLAATQQRHTLILSPFLVSELSRVLRYDRLRKVHGLNEMEIDEYIADLQLVAEMVVPSGPLATVVAFDPDDDPVVATVIAGVADILCTRDRHLRSPAVVTYCRSRGVAVLDDQNLRRLRSC